MKRVAWILPLLLAEVASAEPKPRLAVASIAADGVPEELAAGLTETIATAIARTGVFETISPKQISALLAFEKRKELLGACGDERCYAQIASAVKADHLVAGSIARVGDATLVLNLSLIDAKEAKSLERTERQAGDANEILDRAKDAAVVVLQPLLGQRIGYLKISSNVPDAALMVDDRRRPEIPGQVLALPAGPHLIELSKDGFYRATLEALVVPGSVQNTEITLVPAKDTIASYESKANIMRYGAYASGALAVGAAVLSAVFYSSASDDKALVDAYASSLEIDRSKSGLRDQAVAAQESFDANQGLYVVSLGSAVVLGAASLYLFLAGDDPERYAEFRSLP